MKLLMNILSVIGKSILFLTGMLIVLSIIGSIVYMFWDNCWFLIKHTLIGASIVVVPVFLFISVFYFLDTLRKWLGISDVQLKKWSE